MSNTIKHNIFLTMILFIMYFTQNILRNIFVNIFEINELVATFITVIIFSSVALLIIKKNNYYIVECKNKTCITYIIIFTLISSLINLFPFNLSLGIITLSVFARMFFVGLMEELIFRGCVYKIFFEKYGPQKAVIVSSVLFGLIHILNVMNDNILMVVLQIVYATCIGIVFAMLIYKNQGIILNIIAHTIINITGNLGTTETVYKEIIFTIMCVIFMIIMIFKFGLFKKQNEIAYKFDKYI